MTITTAPVPLSFAGDDSTTAFPIPWKYFAKSHVIANLRDTNDVEALQVITTNYTLTAAGVDSGGTLTMIVPPATGETLAIDLDPPNTQDSALPRGGPFPSVTVEDALDKLTQLVANLDERFDRAMLVPKTDTQTGSNLELPIDSSRASKFLSADANGKIIFAAGTSADLGPVTPYVNTLLDDSDAVTFRQTLLLDKSGADIASAATIDLDASTGDVVDVTGTTTITAITLGDGVEKTVRFTGILTLTDGASLELPGSADIVTAVGDVAVFRGDSGSIVRCIAYQRLTNARPPIVTSFVKSTVFYIADDHGVHTPFFDVDANVADDTWESVGPTGSGATNIWTALDSVPDDNVKWLEIRIFNQCIDNTGAAFNQSVYARKTGSTATNTEARLVSIAFYEATTLTPGQTQAISKVSFRVPIDSSGSFDINPSFGGTSRSINLWLVGFGV